MPIGNALTDCTRERETMINSNMLMTLAYGLYSFVFWQAISLGLRSKEGRGTGTHSDVYAAHRSRIHRNPIFFIVAMIMYALVTAVFAIQWKTFYNVLGPHGGDGEYLCKATASASVLIFCETVLSLNFVLADLVLIWRTFIVYGRLKKVILFPFVFAVAAGGLVVAVIIGMSLHLEGHDLALYNVVFAMNALDILPLVYMAVSILVTIYCSIAITIRIVKICRLGGSSLGSYSNVLELVAESAVLYTAVLLTTFILKFVSERWGSRYAVAVLLPVTGIAPTWILARAISGESRPDSSWTMDSDMAIDDGMQFSSKHTGGDSAIYSPITPKPNFA
ncbi:hypothetical protein CYLTODRAFT_492058 [Cylindrobasidium torrendii FP15055 ss-10]|uniref:Integral membrane protein n=1 Tax=Cylindrobasidium torrendii FP15055 ss-10 TaxID=1314674 RepID=A0A0D7B6D5_9AGAR|nr:hypothetical protein CYLTODRAFT_492058 [Cylindrobasidium torrendii FP15055 ss-10]